MTPIIISEDETEAWDVSLSYEYLYILFGGYSAKHLKPCCECGAVL